VFDGPPSELDDEALARIYPSGVEQGDTANSDATSVHERSAA
jgi:hypothetical protein